MSFAYPRTISPKPIAADVDRRYGELEVPPCKFEDLAPGWPSTRLVISAATTIMFDRMSDGVGELQIGVFDA